MKKLEFDPEKLDRAYVSALLEVMQNMLNGDPAHDDDFRDDIAGQIVAYIKFTNDLYYKKGLADGNY